MKKAFVILIVLALAGAGLYYKHFGKKSDIVYDTTTVSRGPIRVDVTASGTIQPVNIVSVGTQVSGIIEKVFVDYNSIVKKRRPDRSAGNVYAGRRLKRSAGGRNRRQSKTGLREIKRKTQ